MEFLSNMRVTQIESLIADGVGDGVEITTEGGSKFVFDQVIVATRPEQALHFLPPSHPMVPLYQAVSKNNNFWVPRVGIYGVALVEVSVREGTALSQVPNLDQYVTGLLDTLPPLASSDLLSSNSTITPMQITKLFSSSPIISVVYQIPEQIVGTDKEVSSLIGVLTDLGYENIDIIRVGRYPNTPSLLSVDDVTNGWYQQAQAAQGIDDLHFVGEVFSGHGVPTTWLHAEDFVEQAFSLDPKEVRRAKRDRICYPIK